VNSKQISTFKQQPANAMGKAMEKGRLIIAQALHCVVELMRQDCEYIHTVIVVMGAFYFYHSPERRITSLYILFQEILVILEAEKHDLLFFKKRLGIWKLTTI
jgi:hypothetical protein